MSSNRADRRSLAADLEQVVEPLASYICATDRPRAALHSALAVLVREVAATNKAAMSQLRNLLESHRA